MNDFLEWLRGDSMSSLTAKFMLVVAALAVCMWLEYKYIWGVYV